MSIIWRITFLTCVLFIINSVASSPVSKENGDERPEEPSDSTDGESSEKELETVPPKETDETVENNEENAEKSDFSLTSKPEEIPEKGEKGLTEKDDSLMQFLSLFDKIKTEASENKEVEETKTTPDETKEMEEETFKLVNELNEKEELSDISHEEFDKIWNEKEKESGKKFSWIMHNVLISLKEALGKNESATAEETTLEVSDDVTVASTQSVDEIEEESPKGAFTLRNAKGKICILAKFQSSIEIIYLGKSSAQKVHVIIPHSAHTKGKCRGPNGSSILQITWEKFIFSLFFNKTTEDTWGVTLVELTYDTSEPLFDGAAERSAFSLPFG